MIQRIQSIFLALVAVCSFGLFGTDVAETAAPVPESVVFSDAHYTVFDSPFLLAGIGLTGLLAAVAIFLFRNRPLQIKVAYAALVALVATTVFGIVLWYDDQVASTATVEPGIALPVLSTIFAFLAIFYIKKDERLVRSADRLR